MIKQFIKIMNTEIKIMSRLTKIEVFTTISIIILLFTAMINWNIFSWLILVAIVLIVIAWYIKK